MTWTLDDQVRANLLDPDAIAKRLDPIDPRRAALTAGRETLTRIQEHLEGRTSFAIETTLSSKNNLRTMRDAKSRGFFVELIYVCLNAPERNILRVQERVLKGGHDVSEEDVRRRYDRSLDNLTAAIQMADWAIIYDNSQSTYDKMLEFQDNSIVWRAPKLANWVIRALPHLNP